MSGCPFYSLFHLPGVVWCLAHPQLLSLGGLNHHTMPHSSATPIQKVEERRKERRRRKIPGIHHWQLAVCRGVGVCSVPRGAVSAAGLKGGVWDIGHGSGNMFPGTPGLRISWGPPTAWWLVVGSLCPCAMFHHQCFFFSPPLPPTCCYIIATIEQRCPLYHHGRWQNVCSFFPKGHYMIVWFN